MDGRENKINRETLPITWAENKNFALERNFQTIINRTHVDGRARGLDACFKFDYFRDRV